MSSAAPLQRLASLCPNDRVLVILQLHGGNDGLNMIAPLGDYDNYYNVRPNIALPENGSRKLIKLDSTLATNQIAGLHPDMVGIKELYDQGKVNIVQGVSYENANGSHFRSRDILFMGCGSNDYVGSGWAGRYLKDHYAPLVYPKDFPNADMPDPLALEFGHEVSLLFHQGDNISTSIAIDNPQEFFNLVESLPGFEDVEGIDPRGIPPAAIENSLYGQELKWILSLEQKTDQYDDRLLDVYNKGKQFDPNVTYPTTYPLKAPTDRTKNPIAAFFKIVANLLSGGCKTKIFLIRIGGFDTHAEQVDSTDRTMGNHAALLYHISSTIKAFQDDLKARGIEDRVLTMTTSEFGRRIYSNGSYGTDHGTGAPVMLFGKMVQPGLIGTNPDLSKDNVGMQYDYRQIYASILKDWFCVDAVKVDQEFGLLWGNYQGKGAILPIINTGILGVDDFIERRFKLNNCYPNPAMTSTTISFFINREVNVELNLMDNNGILVKKLMNEVRAIGENHVTIDLRGFPPGTYYYQIKAGILNDTKRLIILK
jgi:uncharacterized protein (DUF1501 family)